MAGGCVTESDDAERKRLDLVRNERLKIAASYLNGIAIALLAVGGIAPVIAGATSNSTGVSVSVALISLVCGFTSAALHLLAWRILGGLRP